MAKRQEEVKAAMNAVKQRLDNAYKNGRWEMVTEEAGNLMKLSYVLAFLDENQRAWGQKGVEEDDERE